jgi:hypothetical protein
MSAAKEPVRVSQSGFCECRNRAFASVAKEPVRMEKMKPCEILLVKKMIETNHSPSFGIGAKKEIL